MNFTDIAQKFHQQQLDRGMKAIESTDSVMILGIPTPKVIFKSRITSKQVAWIKRETPQNAIRHLYGYTWEITGNWDDRHFFEILTTKNGSGIFTVTILADISSEYKLAVATAASWLNEANKMLGSEMAMKSEAYDNHAIEQYRAMTILLNQIKEEAGYTSYDWAKEGIVVEDETDDDFEEDDDCPLCFRCLDHTLEEHEAALRRVWEASQS